MKMAAFAIGKMVLDVSGNSFRILPNSISKLTRLILLYSEHLEKSLSPEVEKNYMPFMNLKNLRLLDLWNLWNLENSEYLLLRRELKNLRYLKLGLRYLLLPPEMEKNNMSSKSCSQLEPLLPLEVEENDMPSESWRINLEKSSPLPERRDAEHGSFTLRRLRRTPIRKRREIDDYYKKQIRQLEGYNGVKIMIETGCAPGNPTEDEKKPKRERMAILVTNIASIVLFALMVFASIESK